MFALDVGAMSTCLGEFPLSHLPLFGDFCIFNSTRGGFHMCSVPRVRGMKPVLEITLIQSDSANKHPSSSGLCVRVYLPALGR